MNCYKCGSVLGSGRLCLRCGADVTIYKKIVRISNSCYNAGLEKAKVRDLTGAAELLGKSLQFDKKNIPARNLLGLVYYEMGEIVEALSQWVISKNFQPEENPADEYLGRVQGNKSDLERMNQAIKKFNQALDYIRHDGEDLAIIQLKGVIGQHPRFLKAYQLLALLYIKEGDYSKANKILKRALQQDKGNTYCQKYVREIRGKISKPKKQVSYMEQEMSQQAAEDVIVPAYREKPRVLHLLLGLATGIAVCACTYFFLLAPAIEREENNRWNQTAISYNEKIEQKDSEISSLNSSVTDLQSQVDTMKKEMEQYTGENGTITNYDRLLTALNCYMSEDWGNLASAFADIHREQVESQAFGTVYDFLKNFMDSGGVVEKIFQNGMELYNNYKYNDAMQIFETCVELDPQFDAGIFYIGMCYENTRRDSEAAAYFKRIVDEFPQSQYYQQANSRIR
ncbi:tetratricopeptide repeat protein [Hominifimenecus sp. rT4P-3]|uniref:tetratricopeptide repeat protein n=1 Tax=Hominifimenecus sp. rT4P-3 TaxID=3242979 RepID=UPI003DA58081